MSYHVLRCPDCEQSWIDRTTPEQVCCSRCRHEGETEEFNPRNAAHREEAVAIRSRIEAARHSDGQDTTLTAYGGSVPVDNKDTPADTVSNEGGGGARADTLGLTASDADEGAGPPDNDTHSGSSSGDRGDGESHLSTSPSRHRHRRQNDGRAQAVAAVEEAIERLRVPSAEEIVAVAARDPAVCEEDAQRALDRLWNGGRVVHRGDGYEFV